MSHPDNYVMRYSHQSVGVISQSFVNLQPCVCFPGKGTHITRDMCFPGRGTHITRVLDFQGIGTHITRDMSFPGMETHITTDT